MNLKTLSAIAVLALVAFFLSDGMVQIVVLAIIILAIFILIGEDKIKAFISNLWGKAREVAKDTLPQNIEEGVIVKECSVSPVGEKHQIKVVTDKGEFLLKPQTFAVIPDELAEGKTLKHKVIYTLGENVTMKKEETLITTEENPRIFYVA